MRLQKVQMEELQGCLKQAGLYDGNLALWRYLEEGRASKQQLIQILQESCLNRPLSDLLPEARFRAVKKTQTALISEQDLWRFFGSSALQPDGRKEETLFAFLEQYSGAFTEHYEGKEPLLCGRDFSALSL